MGENKNIILSHIEDYLHKKEIQIKKFGKVNMIDCVMCNGTASATIIPNTSTINCHACSKKYNVIDMVRKLELDKKEFGDEQILHYLKKLLNIKVITDTDKKRINELFDFFKSCNFCMVKIARGDKNPIEGDWSNKLYRDEKDWYEWVIYNKCNIGVLTGKKSNITIIDLDILTKTDKVELRSGVKIEENKKEKLLEKRETGLKAFYEKYGDIIGSPLIQDTLGGQHLIYSYVKELPKTCFDIDGIHIDVENDGGQVVVEPSIIGNSQRRFKELINPPEMSKEFKELLLSKSSKPTTTLGEEIKSLVESQNFTIDPSKFELKNNNLKDCCNPEFIAFGGILRGFLPPEKVRQTMQVVNRHFLHTPMETRAIDSMAKELEKYAVFDEKRLAETVLQYLRDAGEATKYDIKSHTEEKEGRIAKVLKWLVDEEYVIKRGRNYKPVKKINWKQDFSVYGKRLKYKVPYFGSYAVFREGDALVIGGGTGHGKSHIAMNMVKQFKSQGIVPKYIPSEGGGRWSIIAQKLGLKEGDFFFPDERIKPEDIELDDNAVTIIDWLLPDEWEKTDKIFERFDKQLQRHGGLLIIFVQLRKKDKSFYAENMLEWFPSWVCKFDYEDESRNGSYFETTKIREGIAGRHYAKIPCKYDKETTLLKTVEELENEQNKKAKEKGDTI